MISDAVKPVGSDSFPSSISGRFFDTYDITNPAWMRYPTDLMDGQPKVLFYGNSLVLAGVQATFKGYAEFEVITLDKPATELELLAFDPSLIVFDMRALESEFLFAQMQELPGVLFVGVDPESHEVLLTGQAVCSISLEQITQIARDLIGPRVVPPTSPSTTVT
jgi:hypothetical protein